MNNPFPLVRHPATSSSASGISVSIGRSGSALRTRFRIIGDRSGLVLPPKEEAEFRTGLWESTCFELFIRSVGMDEYLELNFSPSTHWAAFQFDAYRKGMRAAPEYEPKKLVSTRASNRYELSVAMQILDRAHLLPWLVGVSAILEEKDGTKSYWALAHPDPDKPDFHHPDCFALELPAA